ncbi:LysR family transcriptional regulator [Marinomonas transparens]|uniref:LysR family transcriptional regulator n=1 Tax=Marinomonas transparens TaxID=2795388 RepID=A0A934N7J0_9GAMM|nr:LysR family transcriptional regulator [Marinomonas transparens]MBJ7539111.1 LysR family transcriptional regulator [Marinomonas transparens]
MLNTQHLLTFKTLVEVGSFTRTAKLLGLTQPAVSQHIQKLEAKLDGSLLIRHGRSTEMTEAGKVLYKYVKELELCYEAFMVAWSANLVEKPDYEDMKQAADK